MAEHLADLPSIHVETGNIWSDGNGSRSLTLLRRSIWKYNIDVSIAAAEDGLQERNSSMIHVRFPEGFENLG